MDAALVALLAFLAYLIPYSILAAAPGVLGGILGTALREAVQPPEAVAFSLDVDPPIRAAGGEFDRISVEVASGTLAGALPVERLAIEARDIRCDVGAALFSHQLVLRAPLEASASVEITEDGLTQFVRSDIVRQQLRGLAPPRQAGLPGIGAQTRIDVVPARVRLDEGRIELKGQVQVPEMSLVVPLTVSARPVLLDATHLTIAEPRVIVMGRVLGVEQLLRGQDAPIVDLSDLASGDVKVRVSRLDLSGGRLTMQANATILRVPATR